MCSKRRTLTSSACENGRFCFRERQSAHGYSDRDGENNKSRFRGGESYSIKLSVRRIQNVLTTQGEGEPPYRPPPPLRLKFYSPSAAVVVVKATRICLFVRIHIRAFLLDSYGETLLPPSPERRVPCSTQLRSWQSTARPTTRTDIQISYSNLPSVGNPPILNPIGFAVFEQEFLFQYKISNWTGYFWRVVFRTIYDGICDRGEWNLRANRMNRTIHSAYLYIAMPFK